MQAFVLHYPGATPEASTTEESFQAMTLFQVLDDHLADAATGLWLFEQTLADLQPVFTSGYHRSVEDAYVAAARAILDTPQARAAAEARWRDSATGKITSKERVRADRIAMRDADLQARRQIWEGGQPPLSYLRRLPQLHARTVLYALDGTHKGLAKLIKEGGFPQDATAAITAAKDAFERAVPHVTAVRDSAHHPEDRARGLRQGGKPVTPKPTTDHGIRDPIGCVIMTSSLAGNKLCYTTADGIQAGIEISTATVTAAQTATQQAINAVDWHGHPYTSPVN